MVINPLTRIFSVPFRPSALLDSRVRSNIRLNPFSLYPTIHQHLALQIELSTSNGRHSVDRIISTYPDFPMHTCQPLLGSACQRSLHQTESLLHPLWCHHHDSHHCVILPTSAHRLETPPHQIPQVWSRPSIFTRRIVRSPPSINQKPHLHKILFYNSVCIASVVRVIQVVNPPTQDMTCKLRSPNTQPNPTKEAPPPLTNPKKTPQGTLQPP